MPTRQFVSAKENIQNNRLYYLDWLRVVAVLLVFLIHCAKIFDFHTTVVVNSDKSLVLSVIRDYILLWVMPLFFIISGGVIFLSKKTLKAGKFIKSRFLRLVIPLLFVGTLIINPLYVYSERLFGGDTVSNFFQWYPNFFNGIYGLGGNFASLGNGTYLWYLEFLFIYSLILLPLLIPSKKTGTSFLSRLSTHFEKPWALILLFVPISAAAILFEAIGLGGVRVMGGWDFISYLLFFGYGYLIFSNAKIMEVINKYNSAFFAIGLILSVLYLDSHFGINLIIPGITRHNLAENGSLYPLNLSAWLAVLAVKSLLSWIWIIALVGIGQRFLNFSNKLLSYANEAVLPFYILHHAIIYVVGNHVIKLDMDVTSKFILISITSLVIILSIYECLIRRINWLRFLFGMKLMDLSNKSTVKN